MYLLVHSHLQDLDMPKSSRPSNPYLEEHYRVDYMVDGSWYFRKFSSKPKAQAWLVKNNITVYTIKKDDGSMLGG